jgi:ATP-dependent Clp protease ATP-binding subunit ClpA
MSKAAKEFLITQGFDSTMGARPLRRAIERYVENPLAEEILQGCFDNADIVEVVAAGDSLKFRQKTAATEPVEK